MEHEETIIQAKIVAHLQELGIFCHSVPNEAASSAKQMMRLISMGLRRGVADLVVWWPDGIGYLEVKTEKGKQSEAQKTFEKRCVGYGVSYDIIRSINELETAILRHRKEI